MIFKRWVVRYKHDKSPVDGHLFVHKSAADDALTSIKNKDKLEVCQIAIMSVEIAEHLAGQLSEI